MCTVAMSISVKSFSAGLNNRKVWIAESETMIIIMQ